MASTAAAGTPAADASEAELMIGGMTCASCAARVEKKLNRMDGVTATVNYATEKARVTFTEGLELSDLVAAVERTGYTARPLAPPKQEPSENPSRSLSTNSSADPHRSPSAGPHPGGSPAPPRPKHRPEPPKRNRPPPSPPSGSGSSSPPYSASPSSCSPWSRRFSSTPGSGSP
nr:heavy metal-associated domain-containing protein [Streptomyces sp. ISL-112]